MTDASAIRRADAVSLLLSASLVGSTLSLGVPWYVPLNYPGYMLSARVFLVAAILLLSLACYCRVTQPRRAESMVFLAAVSLATAVALWIRLFPAPGLVIAAASLTLTVWLKRVLRAQRLQGALSA